MKNIKNTIKKVSFFLVAILPIAVAFSMPTPAKADVWSRLGNFFEDAADDMVDLPGNVWDGVSHTTKSAWDHIEDEVEDWHIDTSWGGGGHDNDSNNHNYSNSTTTYVVKDYTYWNTNCSSCGCGTTSSCYSGWNSTNGNVYGPNQASNYTGGWDSYNNNTYNGYNYNYNNNYNAALSGSCSSGFNNTDVGSIVNWNASASGGNGFYTYYWSGDEGLSSNSQYTTKTYSYGGTKNATVTITSGGQSITRSCSVNINQVLSYTQTNPYVSSVYLSEVPYTGVGDVLKIMLFILVLALWSGLLSIAFLKRKANAEILIPVINTLPVSKENVQTVYDTDMKDIEAVENYARSHKILLSTDAVTKLVKLSRLSGINVSEVIQKIAKSKDNNDDWSALGSEYVEKHLK